jgi:hypothetical protein
MQLSQRFIDYNKQLLFGEIGALAGTPVFPLITSRLTKDPSIISFSAVVGALVAGSVFWLVVKVYDERKRGSHSLWHLAGQVAWFSPAAFLISLMVYQPTLFLAARSLIMRGTFVVLAALVSQMLAFAFYLVAMNVYRLALHRITGRWI